MYCMITSQIAVPEFGWMPSTTFSVFLLVDGPSDFLRQQSLSQNFPATLRQSSSTSTLREVIPLVFALILPPYLSGVFLRKFVKSRAGSPLFLSFRSRNLLWIFSVFVVCPCCLGPCFNRETHLLFHSLLSPPLSILLSRSNTHAPLQTRQDVYSGLTALRLPFFAPSQEQVQATPLRLTSLLLKLPLMIPSRGFLGNPSVLPDWLAPLPLRQRGVPLVEFTPGIGIFPSSLSKRFAVLVANFTEKFNRSQLHRDLYFDSSDLPSDVKIPPEPQSLGFSPGNPLPLTSYGTFTYLLAF